MGCRLLKWAEDNVLVDVVSPGHHGRVLKGWRSNHLRNEGKKGPVAWCTAQSKYDPLSSPAAVLSYHPLSAYVTACCHNPLHA